MGISTVTGATIRHLDELRDDLTSAGYLSKIVKPIYGPPFVHVANPSAYQLAEDIRCEPNAADGDSLWLFWSWDDPICPAGEISCAVKRIKNVIGTQL